MYILTRWTFFVLTIVHKKSSFDSKTMITSDARTHARKDKTSLGKAYISRWPSDGCARTPASPAYLLQCMQSILVIFVDSLVSNSSYTSWLNLKHLSDLVDSSRTWFEHRFWGYTIIFHCLLIFLFNVLAHVCFDPMNIFFILTVVHRETSFRL